MGEVDPDFIQPLEHQPKPSVLEAEGIPLIDLSPFDSQESDAESLHRLVAEVGEACRKWGFFQVINHGVPSQVRDRIESASEEFFALPKEEKRKSSRDETNLFGYSDHEITKSVRDWKEIFDCTIENPTVIYASDDPDDRELKELTNQWPQYPPDLRQVPLSLTFLYFIFTININSFLRKLVSSCREVCEEYAAEMQKLTHKLLELIALSLGLQKDRFHGFFKHQTSFMRLNYYPSCPSPQLALGLGRHKDAGAMTVLYQDNVGGLEVKRKSDGEWIFVKPMSDAYIVNVGDLIQVPLFFAH